MMHIYPVNDLREHELEGTMCWCNPEVLWNDPETGEAYSEGLVIHNLADRREVVEEAERIICQEK